MSLYISCHSLLVSSSECAMSPPYSAEPISLIQPASWRAIHKSQSALIFRKEIFKRSWAHQNYPQWQTAKRRFKRRAEDLMRACCERRRGGGDLLESVWGRVKDLSPGGSSAGWCPSLTGYIFCRPNSIILGVETLMPFGYPATGEVASTCCSIPSDFPCWFTVFLHECHSAYLLFWKTVPQTPQICLSLPNYVFYYSRHQPVELVSVRALASERASCCLTRSCSLSFSHPL